GSSGNPNPFEDGSSQAEVKATGTTDFTRASFGYCKNSKVSCEEDTARKKNNRYDEQSSSSKGSKETGCKEPTEGILVTIHEYSFTWSWKLFKGFIRFLTFSVSVGAPISAGDPNPAVTYVSAGFFVSAASSIPAATPIAAGIPIPA
nr:hypothetical protein [Tanacetum cinerariifolium]